MIAHDISRGGQGWRDWRRFAKLKFQRVRDCRSDSANTARTVHKGFTRKEYAEYREKLTLYDDLLALPDHVVGEIIDGQLHVQPLPAEAHLGAFGTDR
ncbi:MAG: hypothetical protein R3F40_13195 [Candidatus Competibacteraceae bacterium]